jgi:Pyruvate/2-oxoacid:ferredoxin oxidoreductase delta subunit
MKDGQGRIVYCHCASMGVMPAGTRSAVLGGLRASGAEVTVFADLCASAARGEAEVAGLGGGGPLTVIACAPRAVRWLLARAGAEVEPDQLTLLDMRTRSAEEILAAVGAAPVANAPVGIDEPAAADDWPSWFPVIDYERCIDCKQCLNFCLFGVYAEDEAGRVRVNEPDHCKTHCPACARLCPTGAIVFPKHPTGPINGQDDAAGEDETAPAAKEQAPAERGAKLKQMIAGDARALLRARTASGENAASADEIRAAAERIGSLGEPAPEEDDRPAPPKDGS